MCLRDSVYVILFNPTPYRIRMRIARQRQPQIMGRCDRCTRHTSGGAAIAKVFLVDRLIDGFYWEKDQTRTLYRMVCCSIHVLG